MGLPWDASMSSENLIALSGGNSEVFADLGRQLVYKRKPLPPTTLKKFKRRAAVALISQVPQNKIFHTRVIPNAALEMRVLKAWEKEGIPTTQQVEDQKEGTIYKYVPAEPYAKVLKHPSYQERPLAALIATHQAIRSFAKGRQDPFLLHTDSHIGNYLWESHSEVAVAIDPFPDRIKATYSFDVIDAGLNSFLLRSILIHTRHSDRYVEQFGESFTPEERAAIITYNQKCPPYLRAIAICYHTATILLNKPKRAFLEITDNKASKRMNEILQGI